jgi:hypothetical protein
MSPDLQTVEIKTHGGLARFRHDTSSDLELDVLEPIAPAKPAARSGWRKLFS